MTQPSNVVQLRPVPKTYAAKSFKGLISGFEYQMSGTLDGYIDFCLTEACGAHRTYSITCNDARQLIAALNGVVSDVQTNCLFDRDALLIGDSK